MLAFQPLGVKLLQRDVEHAIGPGMAVGTVAKSTDQPCEGAISVLCANVANEAHALGIGKTSAILTGGEGLAQFGERDRLLAGDGVLYDQGKVGVG